MAEQLFFSNITPLFYVETLADLSLSDSPRPPEAIISELAAKTPQALPNVHHSSLVLGNLFGQKVLTEHGRPIVNQGVTKRSPDGKIGVHYDQSPESKAMNRWHNKEFEEIEQEFAKQWRQNLDSLNFDVAIGIVKNILPTNHRFTTLEQIKIFIDGVIADNSIELLILALDFLGVSEPYRQGIIRRWNASNKPPLNIFAPYAMYVFSIDLLFYIGALRGLISKEKHSNKVDFAYLYYLPFCHVFVSDDKLHSRTAPLFTRQDQTFIGAKEFKDGLSKINKYYLQYKDEIEEIGVMSYAQYLPLGIETSIHKLWDIHCPSWRNSAANYLKREKPLHQDDALLKHLKKVKEESEVVDSKILKSMDDADHVIISHKVSVQKGSWRILPKGIENNVN